MDIMKNSPLIFDKTSPQRHCQFVTFPNSARTYTYYYERSNSNSFFFGPALLYMICEKRIKKKKKFDYIITIRLKKYTSCPLHVGRK